MHGYAFTVVARVTVVLGVLGALLVSDAMPVTASPVGTATSTTRAARDAAARSSALPTLATLRRVAPPGFTIGTAVAGGGVHGRHRGAAPLAHDDEYRHFLAAEFSSLTPENQMKWEVIHPEPGVYDFAQADAVVAFARTHGQAVRGHTLLWHRQNPTWLSEGDFSRQELRGILREHILTVVGRYAGQVQQWDVANEIFDDAGKLRDRENIWIRELGPAVLVDAFRWAHQADPTAQLFLNDYNVEGVNAKSTAYHRLAEELIRRGVPVHGFGAQSHYSLQWGFDRSLQANLQRFEDLGLATAITEIDVRIVLNGRRPTLKQLQAQAVRYRRALEACLQVASCQSFTVWGFTDKYSWIPRAFPGQGAATIMGDAFQRKPAYYALQHTMAQASVLSEVQLPAGPDVLPTAATDARALQSVGGLLEGPEGGHGEPGGPPVAPAIDRQIPPRTRSAAEVRVDVPERVRNVLPADKRRAEPSAK